MSSDVEVEVGPFHRPHQFGDVPRPHLVGSLGQQFGLLIDRVTPLSAAFDDLALGCKDAIHRANRTKIDALIEQGGIDLGRGLVAEAGCLQMGKHLISFNFRQSTHGRLAGFLHARRGGQRRAMPMRRGPRHLQCRAGGSRQAAAAGRQIHLVQQRCHFFWMAMIASA